MIGNKLAPVCLAFALPFQDLTDEPPSTGTSPCLYNIGDIVYLRDSAGVSHVLNSTAGLIGILGLAHGGTGADLSAATANATLTKLTNHVANGASAVAFADDNVVDLANASAKIRSFRSAGTEKAAVLGSGALLAPSIGPSATQQHAAPAVASGTLIVSGSSALSDGALQVGDGTHRLNALGVSVLKSGANALSVTSTIPDSDTAVVIDISKATALATGGSAFLHFGNGVATDLKIGCPSMGQTDALCYMEALLTTGAVTAGQVVVWAGAKAIAAGAASAGLTTIAGVAVTSSTGVATIWVARRGRVYANADAGIAAGTVLKTSGAVAGNVVDGAAIAGGIVGRACEATSGTLSGKVLVDLVLG